jgi:DNA invertase Pin-like site-specific DNA recombinase
MRDQAANPSPVSRLVRAAQYVRMSTEHQQYSIANQSAAIALYAAAHNIGIVRSFADEGKTGRSIKHRRALQELLKTVQSGAADFELILVYDVSRWGRFPDADEAAHYEFLCKTAGVHVRYCAEQFENDNSATSNLLKALKRTMAGEYSRELSVKIFDGQRRLAAMGFWQGGSAPFGMQRRIVSQHGEPKEILEFGQWKSVSTDRVVLAPGAQKDVETIQLAFDLYTKRHKTRGEIAPILNQRKQFWGNTPWNISKLRRLFTNPIYKGAYPYCKTHLSRDLPPEKWLIREHSFPAIISEKQWNQARERVREEVKKPIDPEMLEGLRRLWKRKGTITSKLINAAKDIPSAPAYGKHFGGLNEAYRLIGFPIKHDYAYVHAINMTRKMRKGVYDDICTQIRAAGGTAERTLAPERILINGNITAKVNLTTGHLFYSGHVRWVLLLGKQASADIQIFARLEPPHREIMDYFVVPAISQLHGALRPKRENNAPFLDLYRFPTLQPFIKTLGRVPIKRLA